MRRVICQSWKLAVALCAGLLVIGCAQMPRQAAPNLEVAKVAVVPGFTGIRSWGDYNPSDPLKEYGRLFPGVPLPGSMSEHPDGRPLIRVLALSGGGTDGAFGAGLLNGWTASGRRPQFHLVTGISAGALIAPFAYLGPAYDKSMREVWTLYETNELITAQLLPGLLGGPSLADTKPLADIIAKYVDRRFLARVAAEYNKGRILLIGTTNLDVQRPVVWNMGEIARKGTPEAIELFRSILLASAAIPGAFPPVNIKVEADGEHFDEMHVDGGTTQEVFVNPLQTPVRFFDNLYPAPPVWEYYIVKNGKLGNNFKQVKPTTLSISVRAIETLLKRQNASDIYRIYRAAQDARASFNLMAVPEDFAVVPKQAFDPEYQEALFQTGYKIGRSGIAWMKRPPELVPTRSPWPTSTFVSIARTQAQVAKRAVD